MPLMPLPKQQPLPKALVKAAWWRRLIVWLAFWRTPTWHKERARKHAEDRVNPEDSWLLVYDTPNGPAYLGRYKGRADDAYDAAEEAYVNLMFNKGRDDYQGMGDYHEMGGVVMGEFGIVPEDSLTEEQKQEINATTKGE